MQGPHRAILQPAGLCLPRYVSLLESQSLVLRPPRRSGIESGQSLLHDHLDLLTPYHVAELCGNLRISDFHCLPTLFAVIDENVCVYFQLIYDIKYAELIHILYVCHIPIFVLAYVVYVFLNLRLLHVSFVLWQVTSCCL